MYKQKITRPTPKPLMNMIASYQPWTCIEHNEEVIHKEQRRHHIWWFESNTCKRAIANNYRASINYVAYLEFRWRPSYITEIPTGSIYTQDRKSYIWLERKNIINFYKGRSIDANGSIFTKQIIFSHTHSYNWWHLNLLLSSRKKGQLLSHQNDLLLSRVWKQCIR